MNFWIEAILLFMGIWLVPQPIGIGIIGAVISSLITIACHCSNTWTLWIMLVTLIVVTVIAFLIEKQWQHQMKKLPEVAPGETLLGASGVIHGKFVQINGRNYNYQGHYSEGAQVSVTNLIDATTVAVKIQEEK